MWDYSLWIVITLLHIVFCTNFVYILLFILSDSGVIYMNYFDGFISLDGNLVIFVVCLFNFITTFSMFDHRQIFF